MNKCLHLLVLLILMAFGLTPLAGQTFGAYVRAGDKAMEEKEYFAAAKYYEDALSIQENKTAVVFKYANACRLLFAFDKAQKGYSSVARTPGSAAQFPMVYFWLGEVTRQLGDHKKAKKHFERFLKNNPSATGYYYEKARQEVKACDFAILMSEQPVAVTLSHLDQSVNTPYSDFAAHGMGDSLFYSSLRFPSNEKRKEIKISRLLIASSGEKGKVITGNMNQPGVHTANSTFSPDGKQFYFTRCSGENNEDIRCDLFMRKIENETWTKPVPLPHPINLDGYTTTHPSVGFDPNTGKEVLWFSSDREGGKGNMDIWFSVIEPSGNYSDPQNAGDLVNSRGDEVSPYLSSSEKRLYFSSDWHLGFGGFDIFSSELTEAGLNEPVNIGIPVNSINNDIYYVLNPDRRSGFFSSNRKGSLSLSEEYSCCYDIYNFEYPPLPEPLPDPLPPDTLTIVDLPDPELPEITLVPPELSPEPDPLTELEKFLPVTLYFHNDEPDSNTIRNTTRLRYDETYAFYYSLKDQYISAYAKGEETAAMRIEDFFETVVRAGYEKLEAFTHSVAEGLKSGIKMELGIRGFTSPRAPTDYNVHLAKRRISSVKNYFIQFSDGVLLPYFNAGQLAIVETPFGESTAPSGISDAYGDPRNSIYSPEASGERRVEILYVRFKE